jgi:hypothetical protein
MKTAMTKFKVGDFVKVRWEGGEWKAKILACQGDKYNGHTIPNGQYFVHWEDPSAHYEDSLESEKRMEPFPKRSWEFT